MHAIVAVQTQADDGVRAHFFARGVDDADDDAHTVFKRAAVFVFAVVGGRRQELVEQISVRGRAQFNAVQIALDRMARGQPVAVNDLLDVLGLHHLGHLAVDRAGNGRRRPHRHAAGHAVGLPAPVPCLRQDQGVVVVHRRGDLAELADHAWVKGKSLARIGLGGLMHRHRFHGDHRGTAFSAFDVVVHVRVGEQVVFDQQGGVAGHPDAVFGGMPAKLAWTQ